MPGVRRWLLLAGILLALAASLGPRAMQLWGLVGANDWGSDWLWLADGLDRLQAGLPLNRPEYVAAPFSQLANGPSYAWSMHPPWNATLVSPILLLPVELRQAAWTWLMAAVLVAGIWLAWPRRLWWGTHLLVAAVVVAPPMVGWLDQLHFANPNALVILGLGLVWHGRRRRATALTTLGLVLAAVKIAPAVALAAWLLAAWPLAAPERGLAGRPRAVLLGGLSVAALTVPVFVLDPNVIGDTVRVQLNLVPWDGPSNLAPQVLLAPLLGGSTAALLSRIVGLGLVGLVLARRLDGPGGFVIAAAAPLLITPQLWSHWFLAPAVAILLAAGDSSRLRMFDARLRAVWGEAAGIPVGRTAIAGSRPVRAMFAVLGTISLGVAVVGIVLPVLPTTPFLLLAAACYARASSRLHGWLLGQRTLGPVIERWQRNRSMAPAVKRRAMIMVVLTFAVSIIVIGDSALRVALAAVGVTALVFLSRIPTEP